MLAGLAAFGRFWYRFIVGDDWVIAATVLVALVALALLLRAGVQAWWLLPVVVIAVLGFSLWRARRPS
jgi:hypothetical protein